MGCRCAQSVRYECRQKMPGDPEGGRAFRARSVVPRRDDRFLGVIFFEMFPEVSDQKFPKFLKFPYGMESTRRGLMACRVGAWAVCCVR